MLYRRDFLIPWMRGLDLFPGFRSRKISLFAAARDRNRSSCALLPVKRKKARMVQFSDATFREGARMDGITGFRSFPAVLSRKFKCGPGRGGSEAWGFHQFMSEVAASQSAPVISGNSRNS